MFHLKSSMHSITVWQLISPGLHESACAFKWMKLVPPKWWYNISSENAFLFFLKLCFVLRLWMLILRCPDRTHSHVKTHVDGTTFQHTRMPGRCNLKQHNLRHPLGTFGVFADPKRTGFPLYFYLRFYLPFISLMRLRGKENLQPAPPALTPSLPVPHYHPQTLDFRQESVPAEESGYTHTHLCTMTTGGPRGLLKTVKTTK